jgi:uncharacterized membrane protein YgcG
MDPFTILAIVTAASTGVQMYGQTQAGKAQEQQLKEQARQEEVAAQSQELQRRQELNRALAANVAALSTAGISGEGTPASLALESAKQVGLSEMTIDLSERLRRASLQRQAGYAKQAGQLAATSTLLKSGLQLAQLAGGGGGGSAGGSSGGSSGGGD